MKENITEKRNDKIKEISNYVKDMIVMILNNPQEFLFQLACNMNQKLE